MRHLCNVASGSWNPLVLCAGALVLFWLLFCDAGVPCSLAADSSAGSVGGSVTPSKNTPGVAVKDELQPLFVAKDFPKGWVFFSAENGKKLGESWKVEPAVSEQDTVLVCLGKPFGYIRTESIYENFEFRFEWKYVGDKNANSGILLYTNGPDMIWPQAVQVQLHRPTAGSVLTDGGAKAGKNTVETTNLDLAVNEWHRCLITSHDGRVTVTINDHKTAEVVGCFPRKGGISIQSEGSEIHFRRLQIKPLSR